MNSCLWHASKQPLIIHQAFENALGIGGKSGISLSGIQGREFLFSSAELPVFLLHSSETELLTSEIKWDMRLCFLPFSSIKPRGMK